MADDANAEGDRFQSEEKRADRDASGRFQEGHGLPGPGRPRGFDLRSIVRQRAEAENVDVAALLWGTVQSLLRAAAGGDVLAAKAVIRAICDDDPRSSSVSLVVNTGVPDAPHTDYEKAQRLEQILANANAHAAYLETIKRGGGTGTAESFPHTEAYAARLREAARNGSPAGNGRAH